MTTADQDRRAAEEIALLPCPFCGGTAEIMRAMGETWVHCPACKGNGPAHSARDASVAAWNRRALVQKAREEEHRMVEQANRMIVIPIPKGTKTVTYAADRPSRIEVDLRKRAVLIYRHDRDEIGITPSPPESERSDKVRQEK